jgi:hypothetical protein
LRFSLCANGAKATLDPATPQKPPKKIGKKIESPEAPAARSAPRPLLQPPVARRRRPAPLVWMQGHWSAKSGEANPAPWDGQQSRHQARSQLPWPGVRFGRLLVVVRRSGNLKWWQEKRTQVALVGGYATTPRALTSQVNSQKMSPMNRPSNNPQKNPMPNIFS